jgi:hypothetical protein
MLAETVVLVGESVERFNKLLADFVAEFDPRTESEFALVANLTTARWRQLRVSSIQKADFNREMVRHNGDPVHCAAFAFRNLADNSRTIDLAWRYETAFDRQFLRYRKLLEEIRRRRASESASGSDSPPQLPINAASATFESTFFPNEPSPNSEHPGS